MRAGTAKVVTFAMAVIVCSCAASARITGLLDQCQNPSANCSAECAESTQTRGKVAPGPGDSSYCDTLEIYQAEAIVAGTAHETNPAALNQHMRWTGYLCGEGVARACAVRDGLRPLVAQSDATITADKARTVSDATEGQAISDAVARCSQIGDTACKAKCDGDNDTSYCVAWAWRLRSNTPPPLDDERAYLKKACDAGNQHACGIIPVIEQQIQAQARQAEAQQRITATRQRIAGNDAEGLWADVEGIAEAMLIGGRGFDPSSRGSRRFFFNKLTPGSQQWTAAVNQSFCPGKKAFIEMAGAADFTQRAATYCNNPRPDHLFDLATCQALFAARCP